MLLKDNIMAENCETAGGKGNIKLALGSLLAAVGLSLSGCGESNAQDIKPAAKEVKLANAQEATAFASLPRQVQSEIRAAYDKCMGEVDDFAKDGNEGDPEAYRIEFEDGQDDCDSMRNSRIRIKKADQDMDNITREITSAG